MSNTKRSWVPPDHPDAGERLAGVAAELTFQDLPQDAVTAAKWGILDTLGVSLAATGTPSAAEYLTPIQQYLGLGLSRGDVPAPTLGKRYSVFDAILWLGAISHSLDYDDVAGYSHPSAPAVSAALPVAHSLGQVDGKRLITAVALGQDMTIRLAQALSPPSVRPRLAHLLPGRACRRGYDLQASQSGRAADPKQPWPGVSPRPPDTAGLGQARIGISGRPRRVQRTRRGAVGVPREGRNGRRPGEH